MDSHNIRIWITRVGRSPAEQPDLRDYAEPAATGGFPQPALRLPPSERGPDWRATYHLRQEKGQHEVDIILEYGGGRVFAFEIKAGSAPTRADARHLTWLRTELGDRFIGGAVLHTGPRVFALEDGILAAPIATLWS